MKKANILKLCFFLLLSLFICRPVNAQGIQHEHISLFEMDVTLEKNTDIRIKEKIHYYFPLPRHGIYRYIPINKRDKGNSLRKPTSIDLLSLRYYPANQPSLIKNRYKKETKFGKNVILQIGDEDEKIQGAYVYEIDYIVKNGINYFENHDELYWNIIGTGWKVPIQKVHAIINLPGEIKETLCYTGVYGVKDTNCTIEKKTDKTLLVTNNSPLPTGNALTLAVSMPKGSIDDVREKERQELRRINMVAGSLLLLIPLFAFLIFKKWKLRSPKLTIMPNFKPDRDMSVLIGGHLLSKFMLNPKALTGEIIYLATEGFLEIEQVKKKEYILRKKENNKEIKMSSTRELYNALFANSSEINTKDENSQIVENLGTINSQIKKDTQGEGYGYIDENKIKINTTLSVASILLCVGSFFAMIYLLNYGMFVIGLAAFTVSLFLLISSLYTDYRTELGNKAYYSLLGLKRYIATAEKHRIEFHNDPEKYRGVFEKLLPYAILFGLEKKWIKEFEDIYTTQPDWYAGDMSTFSAYHIANSVSGISSSIIKATNHSTGGGFSDGSSGFGGGGFSGGGGGGGGGGSW